MVELGVREIALAAMLHDIGKFAQRAGAEGLRSPELEALLSSKARFGEFPAHRHVLYTHGFIEKYLKGAKGIDPSRAALLAAHHHSPFSCAEWIIALADGLSSGRGGSSRAQAAEGQMAWESQASLALANLLDGVSFDGLPFRGSGAVRLLPLEPDSFLPVLGNPGNLKEPYAELYRRFLVDFEKLAPAEMPESQFDAALEALLERYLSPIPSFSGEAADLSLYDHSRLASAFASALYKYHEEDDSLLDEKRVKNGEERKFLFVSGELSGIRGRIFSLKANSQATRILRARSFEIGTLSETWSSFILDSLGLPLSCRIMNSQDRFLILAQNTQAAVSRLEAARSEIEASFLKLYLGELSLCLSFEVSASAGELLSERAAYVYSRILEEGQRARLREFRSVLLPGASKAPEGEIHLFDEEYRKLKETGKLCPLCGKRAASAEYRGEELCPSCASGFRWGSALAKASWIQTGRLTRGDLLPDGKKLYIAKSEEKWEFREASVVSSLNEFRPGLGRAGHPYRVPLRAEDSAQLDGKGERAFKKGDSVSLHELAEIGNGKIALLRADLDNLGAVFSFGMGTDAPISRQASLSRILDYFFTNWVDRLLKEDFPLVYPVFSGGGGLCVLGPWDKTIDFSFALKRGFDRLTGGNPSLGISAGLALAGASIPLGFLAEEAEEALEAAKSYRSAGGSLAKNAFGLFGVVGPWQEQGSLVDEGRKLLSSMELPRSDPSRIPIGIVRKLLGFAEDEEAFREGRMRGRRALWRSSLAFAAARDIKDETTRGRFVELALRTIPAGKARIPAEYALHSVRGGG